MKGFLIKNAFIITTVDYETALKLDCPSIVLSTCPDQKPEKEPIFRTKKPFAYPSPQEESGLQSSLLESFSGSSQEVACLSKSIFISPKPYHQPGPRSMGTHDIILIGLFPVFSLKKRPLKTDRNPFKKAFKKDRTPKQNL